MHQQIAGVAVFEADSAKRIATRYFDSSLRSHESQIAFEKALISKSVKSSPTLAAAGIGSAPPTTTQGDKPAKDGTPSSMRRAGSTDVSAVGPVNDTAEVVLVDNFIVLLRLVNDVLIAVVANDAQNDLLVNEYLTTLVAAMNQVMHNNISKKKVYDRLDQMFLLIDESVEDGCIFELDPHSIVARIAMNTDTPDGSSTPTTTPGAPRPITTSTAVRDGLAAIRSGDTESLRSVFAGAAQSFSNFLGR